VHFHRLLAPIAAAALACGGAALAAQTSQDKPWGDVQCVFPQPDRVVVVGEVLGEYERLVELLQSMELIDEAAHWTGGRAHLVQLGNLYGPNAGAEKANRLMMRLDAEAKEAGGRVHSLIGDQDFIVLSATFSALDPATYAEFARDSDQETLRRLIEHKCAQLTDDMRTRGIDESQFDALLASHADVMSRSFGPGGATYYQTLTTDTEYGRWLRSRNTVVQIGDLLYSRGGVSAEYARRPLNEINDDVRRRLWEDEIWVPVHAQTEPDAPLWWRTLSQRREGEVYDLLEWIAWATGTRAQVMSHSPVDGPLKRGRAIYINSRVFFYRRLPNARPKGELAAMEIKRDEFLMHDGEEVETLIAPPAVPEEEPPRPAGVEPLEAAAASR